MTADFTFLVISASLLAAPMNKKFCGIMNFGLSLRVVTALLSLKSSVLYGSASSLTIPPAQSPPGIPLIMYAAAS